MALPLAVFFSLQRYFVRGPHGRIGEGLSLVLPTKRRPGAAGMQPLAPQRKWRAITLATLLLAPAVWSLLAGLVAVAADDRRRRARGRRRDRLRPLADPVRVHRAGLRVRAPTGARRRRCAPWASACSSASRCRPLAADAVTGHRRRRRRGRDRRAASRPGATTGGCARRAVAVAAVYTFVLARAAGRGRAARGADLPLHQPRPRRPPLRVAARPSADEARGRSTRRPVTASAARRRFPADFLWGAATSAFQIEGGVDLDGRGPSIWDTFCATPGTVAGGDDARTAADHRQPHGRRRRPAGLASASGRTGSRSRGRGSCPPVAARSARTASTSTGPSSTSSSARGSQPVVTLYHWDLPQALEDLGGWPARDTASWFADYAAVVGAALGGGVRRWSTVNEPWCASMLGYAAGVHAPGRTEPGAAVAASHHLLLAHGLAVDALRATAGPKVEVAISLNPYPVVAAGPTERGPGRRPARRRRGQPPLVRRRAPRPVPRRRARGLRPR